MITALVCTYNRCESLRDTLEALGRQQLKSRGRLEVVVIDNNSTDGTPDVVRECAARARWPMRYVFEGTQGLSHARNAGVREAQGEFIAFTDDDVVPEASWAQALWDAAVRFKADAVGGPIRPLWEEDPPEWLRSEAIQRNLEGLLTLLDRGPRPLVARPDGPKLVYGANMGFRKSVFERVGTFRTDLGRNGTVLWWGEETEFLQRLMNGAKGRVVYTPDALVYHKVEPERMRMSYARQRMFCGGQSDALKVANGHRMVPAWFVRECLQDGLRALWTHLRRDRAQAIRHELEFWRKFGRIIGGLRTS